MAGFRSLLLRRAHGRFRHRRHRLYRTFPCHRMGCRARGAGARLERGVVRPRVRGSVGRAFGGSLRATQGSDRSCCGVRASPRSASAFSDGLTALVILRFVTGLGLGAAMPNAVTLRSANIAPTGATRHAHQCHVLRVPFGSRLRRVPGSVDDPAFRLAQRAGAGAVRCRWFWRCCCWHSCPNPFATWWRNALPAAHIRRCASPRFRRCRPTQRRSSSTKWRPRRAGAAIGTVVSRPYLVGTLMLWAAYFMGLMIFLCPDQLDARLC